MSFPRYSEYKESAVEWLGPVPKHWSMAAVGYRYEVALGKMLDSKRITGNNLRPYLRNTDVQWGQVRIGDLPLMDFDEDDRVRYRVLSGDLLVCEGGEVGRAALWRGELEECYYQKALHRLRALDRSKDAPEFMLWLMHAAAGGGCFAADEAKATIAHLPAEALRRVRLPFPPKAEQVQIASFLDQEAGKIDVLVAEQERLIELLKEKRQAVISHAVTKGLNPNAPMKDSGIEWLGQIPAHWEILKGGRIGALFGSEQVSEEEVTAEGAVPFIKVSSLSSTSFDVESWDWFVSADVAVDCRTRTGFLVFPKRGAAIFLNKVNIVARPSLIDPNLMGWAIGPRATLQFMAFALKARRLDELADVSTVPQINNKHIAPEPFAVPPLGEQREIADFLLRETERLDSLTDASAQAILLLYERRAALISAAVTGQIDVRETSKRSAA